MEPCSKRWRGQQQGVETEDAMEAVPAAAGYPLQRVPQVLLDCVKGHRGAIVHFLPDTVMLAFNAFSSCRGHTKAALHCCLQLVPKLHELGRARVHIALESGRMPVGRLGCESHRVPMVYSPAWGQLRELIPLARRLRAPLVCGPGFSAAARATHHLRPLVRVAGIMAYQVLPPHGAAWPSSTMGAGDRRGSGSSDKRGSLAVASACDSKRGSVSFAVADPDGRRGSPGIEAGALGGELDSKRGSVASSSLGVDADSHRGSFSLTVDLDSKRGSVASSVGSSLGTESKRSSVCSKASSRGSVCSVGGKKDPLSLDAKRGSLSLLPQPDGARKRRGTPERPPPLDPLAECCALYEQGLVGPAVQALRECARDGGSPPLGPHAPDADFLQALLQLWSAELEEATAKRRGLPPISPRGGRSPTQRLGSSSPCGHGASPRPSLSDGGPGARDAAPLGQCAEGAAGEGDEEPAFGRAPTLTLTRSGSFTFPLSESGVPASPPSPSAAPRKQRILFATQK